MKAQHVLVLALGLPALTHAQESEGNPPRTSFDEASKEVKQQLDESIAELDELRRELAEEKIPLTRELNDLESELLQVRSEFQDVSRSLTRRTLDLTNLRSEIKARKDEAAYLSSLLGDYIRNFETTLHVVEDARYAEVLEAAKLAPDNSNLSKQEVFQAQAALLGVSLDRLHELLGGVRFDGTAVSDGLVEQGTFVLVGPSALFRSAHGEHVGTAELRIGSPEPSVVGFNDPEDADAAAKLATDGEGLFPLDPTGGNAHKIEATEESFVEHVEKGGPVMVPIFALAGLALLVAFFKWLGLLFVRRPSGRRVAALMNAVREGDEEGAKQAVAGMKGPIGRMLAAGLEHVREPRDLIEEIMYETVLTTRLKLQRFLPFIAICAASAPLLGLLGTVTGIINTFKMITVYGSGDVKSLSGGISEALITTKFGLIVAIPSLLVHAFLSRKARAVIGQMEKTAVTFVNQVSRAPFARAARSPEGEMPAATHAERAPRAERAARTVRPVVAEARNSGQSADPDLVRIQVKEVLSDLLEDMDDRLARRQPSSPEKGAMVPQAVRSE